MRTSIIRKETCIRNSKMPQETEMTVSNCKGNDLYLKKRKLGKTDLGRKKTLTLYNERL
jgi:hypothetical protein